MKDCTYCGNELDNEELENPYKDDDNDIMCDECYNDTYMQTCPLCEDYYEIPTKPEELYFIISKEAKDDVGIDNMKSGIYQTTSWPYWLGATGFGFEMLFEDSIKLIREIDINSMMNKIYGYGHSIGADEICTGCVKKYTETKYKKRIEWTDEHTRLHWNIYERGVINNGF